MKTQLPLSLITALLCVASQAVAEDITDGTILALDRKAGMMVMTDRTVWSLEAMKAPDRVEIRYESDEEGVGEINSIELMPPEKSTTDGADISEGTVLVYDRKANLVILSDRTVWALELSKSPAPAGLKSGDRIRIEYGSDEDGISSINGIEILTN